MAFNFSAPTPAPAASGSGFSFGGATSTTNAAPTPSTSLFGAKPASTTPAPASGGLFGAPAPATGGLFGSTTAPAPSTGGLFGSTAAPKPATTGLFGSTPAPAPAGGLFGSTPATAPAGGLFGSTTTAAAPSTGLFGSTTTPAPAAGSLFGSPAPTMQQQQQQQQQQMQQSFNGNTPYAQLPENAKRAIDQIYQLMMQHRRTLASVKTMAPSLLQSVDNNGSNNYTQSNTRSVSTPGENLSPADAAAGSPRRSTNQVTVDPSSEPLPQQMVSLQTQIQTLLQSAETNLNEAKQLKERAGEAAVQAKMHGAWPIENVAARRGVALSSIKELVNNNNNNNATPSASGGNTTSGTQASSVNVSGMTNLDAIALQQIMDIRASHVDRIESMPSPYYWEVLHNFEQRVSMVQRDVDAVRSRLAIAEEAERVQAMGSSGIMRDETALLRANTEGSLASLVLYEGGSAPLSTKLATLARSQHDYFIRIAALAAQAHDGLEEAKHRYQRFCQTTKGGYYDDPFLKADIEEVSRERELQQRIMEERIATAPPPQAPVTTAPNQTAPSGGLFGAKAPAPSTGLFGSTAAPKPASTGLFGSTPVAAAPAGGLFGATTAPKPAASGGLFGATPAAAPAGGGLFGSNPAPAPAAAGGGLFGSTAPAPAPTTGLFGAPQPAAAPAFGAAPTTPASTLAPRKKSGSRSGGRRR